MRFLRGNTFSREGPIDAICYFNLHFVIILAFLLFPSDILWIIPYVNPVNVGRL